MLKKQLKKHKSIIKNNFNLYGFFSNMKKMWFWGFQIKKKDGRKNFFSDPHLFVILYGLKSCKKCKIISKQPTNWGSSSEEERF